MTWLTKTLRASGATSESMPTTLTPRCAACLSAGATALGSLPAMMIASGFCWTAALMNGICDDAARVGRAGDLVRAAELLERLVDARVLELLVGVAELLRDRDRLHALLDRSVGIGRAEPPSSTAPLTVPTTPTARSWSRRRRRARAPPQRPGPQRRSRRAARAAKRTHDASSLVDCAPSPRLCDATGEVRTQDRADEQGAGDDLDPVRRDRVAEQHRLLDAAEQEQREDDPGDRAAAAEDRDAAQQHRGDRGQLEALADVRGAPSSCAAR